MATCIRHFKSLIIPIISGESRNFAKGGAEAVRRKQHATGGKCRGFQGLCPPEVERELFEKYAKNLIKSDEGF